MRPRRRTLLFREQRGRVSLEPIYIRISKADNVRHAYLGLEGTILLVLPLGVLMWFAYWLIQYRRQPWEYRQAVHSYLRGDLDSAIDALQNLRSRLADYVPTYFLLAEVFTRTGRFEEALDMASYLSGDYPDLARQMQSDIWLFKRIHQRRHATMC